LAAGGICDHLEALTFGDVPSNRLLINVPPGYEEFVPRFSRSPVH
jgi:hypothetical protein